MVFHDLAEHLQAVQRLQVRREKAKRDLSSAKVTITWLPSFADNLELDCKITQQEFENICHEEIEDYRYHCFSSSSEA